ncbi:MAG: DUF805 domain-containing protein [Cyanobacteria bacterium]|nr:DUF805 domain-containing protein [Cyanobacteriota bacterium]
MSELIDSFRNAWQRSFDFEGRSRRPAFWWFTLANFIVSLGLILLSGISNIFGWIYSLYALVVLVPTLSLSVRRLRDGGKHWAWIFITLIPVAGTIWFLYLMCQPTAGALPPGLI